MFHPNLKIEFLYLENRVKIIIEDNGGGVIKENLEYIFNMNFSTKNESGSGVGLALAKKLIEKRLEGAIMVENNKNCAKFTILIGR